MGEVEWILVGLFLLVAVLYSSVGHAGASGYLACMALLSAPPRKAAGIETTINGSKARHGR